MKITALSEDEYYDYLERPHNPPDATAPTQSFDEEYYRLFDQVESIMSEYGENSSAGDYLLEPHIVQSRGLGFEVANADIITDRLLHKLQALLVQHAPSWELFLGSSQCDFGIFIGAAGIRMHRQEDRLPQLDEFVADAV